ncbi:urease accessory protein UreD [Alteromonas sp. IB21]|jgi:urease accessory protein|nr:MULTISPECIES: urease accessory protein UreD [Alteromonas]AGP82731.1 putative urease accessory protein UreD [Alteromonas mediterranea MED64]AGP86593.1 putative urease accessory protein UreD [Alteromonas mediterranea U4]MBJ2127679.1 urease accessory protein UreD [Alteromonas sp. IB21]MEA3379470.1 urease accessory protein UreD [Pseudomonadota bacterium]|tara:strand:+ start:8005 stop:8967 length:963 start_codon:yes stop_codon:yes gene_type:complete
MDDMKQEFAYEKLSGASSSVNKASAFKGLKNKWLASLFLEFAIKSNVSQLVKTSRRGPLNVQKAFYPEGKDCAHVYLLHPPAGIVSGDELNIEICIQDSAHALITTPGANRFYRARTNLAIGDSKQTQISNINVLGKGICENFPLETIVYEGADAINQLDLKLSSQAHYIGWDISCLGLPAAGQPFKKGRFTQLNRVFIDGKLNFHDRINLTPNNNVCAHVAGLNNHSVFATMLAHAPKVRINVNEKSQLVDRLREQIAHTDGIDKPSQKVSVTYIRDLLVVRYLGDHAEECKAIFTSIWKTIRPIYIQKEANVPRIWLT